MRDSKSSATRCNNAGATTSAVQQRERCTHWTLGEACYAATRNPATCPPEGVPQPSCNNSLAGCTHRNPRAKCPLSTLLVDYQNHPVICPSSNRLWGGTYPRSRRTSNLTVTFNNNKGSTRAAPTISELNNITGSHCSQSVDAFRRFGFPTLTGFALVSHGTLQLLRPRRATICCPSLSPGNSPCNPPNIRLWTWCCRRPYRSLRCCRCQATFGGRNV